MSIPNSLHNVRWDLQIVIFVIMYSFQRSFWVVFSALPSQIARPLNRCIATLWKRSQRSYGMIEKQNILMLPRLLEVHSILSGLLLAHALANDILRS